MHVYCTCVCVCVSMAYWPQLDLWPCLKIESRDLVGEQAGGIAGITGVHELKCVHESLKHRWSARNMGPQTAHLSRSRMLGAFHLCLQPLNWLTLRPLHNHFYKHISLRWTLMNSSATGTLSLTEISGPCRGVYCNAVPSVALCDAPVFPPPQSEI